MKTKMMVDLSNWIGVIMSLISISQTLTVSKYCKMLKSFIKGKIYVNLVVPVNFF
jgi:hypothetical protein